MRESLLNDAKQSLERFLAEHPEDPKSLFVRRQYSLVLRQWAKMKVEAARRQDDSELMKEAASLYEAAFQASLAATKEQRAELLKLKDKLAEAVEQKDIEYRDQLRGEYLLSLLLTAESLEEKASTEPSGSEPQKKTLGQAITRYAEMFEKYGVIWPVCELDSITLAVWLKRVITMRR